MAVNSDNILKKNRGIKLDANNNYKDAAVPSISGSSDDRSGDLPSFGPNVYKSVDSRKQTPPRQFNNSGARILSPNFLRMRPGSPHPLTLSTISNIPALRPWSGSSQSRRSKLLTPVSTEGKSGLTNSSAKSQNKKGVTKKASEKNISSALVKLQKRTSDPLRSKKKVSFATDVVIHERETKPLRPSNAKRALQPFGDRKYGYFIPPAAELIRCPSPIPNRHVKPICVNKATMQYRVPNTFGREIEENDHVRFTHIWRTPNMEARKTDDKSIVRLKRIHNIMTDLTDSHSLYRYIPETIRTKFLQEEILPRYVMALDLVLTEGLLGVAIAIINTIRETVGFLHKIYYDEFFDEDHTALNLPSVSEKGPDYVDRVAPIVFTLNRMSGERTRSDSSHMSKETACTKLVLELMALSVLPSDTVMFRCVLGIIPDTATNCIKYLSAIEDETLLGWVNNSVMRRECMICMTKLGLADEFGAKAVLPALSLATIYAMSANNASKKSVKEKPRHRSKTTTIGTNATSSRPATPRK